MSSTDDLSAEISICPTDMIILSDDRECDAAVMPSPVASATGSDFVQPAQMINSAIVRATAWGLNKEWIIFSS